jgi:hypothetical protein
MWKELIEDLKAGCRFVAPTDSGTIRQAEKRLLIKFPDDLCDLLLETNGIWEPSGAGLVWPIERIVADNIQFRSLPDFRELYMPFDHLLFFGDEGGGDQYAFRILAGAIRYNDVYEWIHENDTRQWFAGAMRDYLARSLGHDSFFSTLR